MSYAALMTYVNVDRFEEYVVCVAVGLADRFSAALIGVSGFAITPPFVTEGVVVESVTDAEIQVMQDRLDAAGKKFRAIAGPPERCEWRAKLEFPTETLVGESPFGTSE